MGYYDHDFVCGAMSNAGSEAAWEKMRDYIVCAQENGQNITSDDILALSLYLREETEQQESERNSSKKGIRVAML